MTDVAAQGLLDEVVLLDEAGRPIGRHDRLSVHSAQTPLHLAFSVYLFDLDGRVLLTRRALAKRTWPGVWTNSCCGHPRPGEDPVEAARRRIAEELGLSVATLRLALPTFRYQARDAGGLVENEVCPVYVATVTDTEVTPDPDEVMDHLWLDWTDLVTAAAAAPGVYSPWSVLQIAELAPVLNRRGRLGGAAPTVADTFALVDDLITAEGDALAKLWRGSVPDVDVSGSGDLPQWLQRLLLGGGKRLRTEMIHWGYLACGGRRDGAGYHEAVRAAAALETLHLFALVHDDVMDDSARRRGLPAAHLQARDAHTALDGRGSAEVFGRNLAILLGDLAHARADRLAAELTEPLREAWFALSVELMAGQRADLSSAAIGVRDVDEARRIAELKSGSYTVTRPLQLGAMAAGARADQWSALSEAGALIGQAFALRDDLLGVWGDPDHTGKPAGDDLIQAKPTVIMALARDTLTGEDGAALDRVSTPLRRPDDVAFLREALVRTGVRDRIEAMVTEAVRGAQTVLDGAQFTDQGRAGLLALTDRIAWRNT